MGIKINKEKLEALIQESIDSSSEEWFVEDRFAIHIGDDFEVQMVVTKEESDFVGDIIKGYN